jgi:5'-nucleotidase
MKPNPKKLNILLVNDDGYEAPGLLILNKVLQNYGNVTIVAPTHHMSGKSVSMTFWGGLTVNKLNDNHYHLNGTPADCVLFARTLVKDIDLVVSGCNNGNNVSYDTIYSGTVGACVEANMNHFPSIAFSTDDDYFEVVEKEAIKVLDFVFKNKLLSPNYILNVNFPVKEFPESKGIKLTTLGFRKDHIYHRDHEDGRFYAYRDINWDHPCNSDCDYVAIKEGYTSITPLSYSLFDNAAYFEIKQKIKK